MNYNKEFTMKRRHQNLPMSPFIKLKRTIFFKLVARYLFNDCETIIDIGCGAGEFLDEMKGRNVIGIDLNESYAERDDVINQDFKDIKTRYDGVFCYGVLEHVNQFELYHILSKCCKKKLILITGYPKTSFWNSPDHIRPYTPTSLRKLNKSYGFKTVFCRRISRTMVMTIAMKEAYGNEI